ncbi:hypothetical protein LU11_gp340 [Pseudomonas phage Lu11]|uniref:hypothetical protein n=1 Tax=Pseudomonas phage Lu11 TaxID=1161927 RepID=UPI00025F187E|nr:hypothetical protein LU11_gp340 [Pseudomonas phage Lu11]AFH14871.1 hypothetical protein Lu11_0333 [Pseudomonas phage Lu11]
MFRPPDGATHYREFELPYKPAGTYYKIENTYGVECATYRLPGFTDWRTLGCKAKALIAEVKETCFRIVKVEAIEEEK